MKKLNFLFFVSQNLRTIPIGGFIVKSFQLHFQSNSFVCVTKHKIYSHLLRLLISILI